MSELDGRPYVTEWESDERGGIHRRRVIKFRVCFPLRMDHRLSRPFRKRGDAERFASKHDGLGNLICGPHPDSKRQPAAILRDGKRNTERSLKGQL